jgi:predicted AlkP superfamily pyrophosphatase or phosphodiesterase
MALAAGVASAQGQRPPLIVVSIDGFRAEYLDRNLTPNLVALGREGVRAPGMRPSFPSVTEPNHYTLMTGLYPDHHGIVDNTMIDPAMPGVAFGGPHGHGEDMDPRWWDEATPLWVTAERHGLKTATSLWPGDDAVVHGVSVTYRQPRPATGETSVSMDSQMDSALGWLDLPPTQRPALIRVHLDAVDLMGHLAGPDSPQTNAAIGRADAAIGRLVEGLEARGLFDKVNLVVVSDHGMTGIASSRVIYLDDIVDTRWIVVPAIGAEAGIDPLPGHAREVEAALLRPHDHMTCWPKADIPKRLHYGSNRRVPEIVCLGELGWSVVTRAQASLYPHLLGKHGYDPAEPSMAAIFLAHGPAFRSGVVLPVFDNVDVYPLLARVMGLRPLHNDGDLRPLEPALADP